MNKILIVLLMSVISQQTFADYKDDVGYTRLQADLGSSTPAGRGVAVAHVEAAIGASETDVGAWMPDVSATQFNGKRIVDRSSPLSNGVSGHATGVGGVFYGDDGMASGIMNVNVYSADNWLIDGFLKTGHEIKPLLRASRIANHSWVGSMEGEDISAQVAKENAVRVLKRVDWLVEEDEFIQLVAMNNGSINQPLLGNSYNSIAVGRTDANHAQGSIALDSTYNAARTRPDVVAPVSTTSRATPVVSAAAAMLVEQAHNAAQGSVSVISNGDAIFNGERSEVVKAVIMAGADRITSNISIIEGIDDYRTDVANQTANGLDSRYGAGQLNVYNNYQIMAAGEQDSVEDGGSETVAVMGYDYDEAFGGAEGTNAHASYVLDTIMDDKQQLTASLVWNIDIENNGDEFLFSAVASLSDLDLYLFDVTGESELLINSSTSEFDNTENIWSFVEQGHDYRIDVTAADGESFNRDYALAWKVSAVPVPAAVWFFVSGLLGLFAAKRYV